MLSTWGKSVCFLKKFRLLRTGPAGDTMDTYFDLGGYSFPVTTKSTEAQTWFDRGILWTYGYNHEEAVTCFERAIEADPKCAVETKQFTLGNSRHTLVTHTLTNERVKA